MAKRKATPQQLANLARGREKLFQKQLAQRRINPNPKQTIIREIIKIKFYLSKIDYEWLIKDGKNIFFW